MKMLIIKINLNNILPILALSGAMIFTACDTSGDSAEKMKEDVENEMVQAKENAQKTANNATAAIGQNESETERRVYTIADVDTQPIFGLECPVQDDPIACSNEKMLDFIKENTEFPRAAEFKGQDGFEQVIVVVEKDGSLSDLKYAASSQKKECDGCQKAAVDVVGKMTDWTPGMKNGEPVAVQITIPVRFDS